MLQKSTSYKTNAAVDTIYLLLDSTTTFSKFGGWTLIALSKTVS